MVEGETDAYVFAECAKLLGIELHSIGVRFLEISQAGGTKTYIKVARNSPILPKLFLRINRSRSIYQL